MAIASCALLPRPAPTRLPGAPDHHLSNGTFRNPAGSPTGRASVLEMTAFMWRRLRQTPPSVPADHVIAPAQALSDFRAVDDSDSLTWLGHAAFLLRINGKVILTDPYLSTVAGPYGFGPERYVEPGLPVTELPPVDIVLVSHNHYDHLDAETIDALPGKERLHVVVPLKLGGFFRERGYRNVHELDWYESLDIDGIAIEVLPAIHFSRRGAFDRNRSLWGGFAIRAGQHRIYHSGDTAYGPVFTRIGQRAGPFDLALVAIGAYDPRSIMSPAHVTPEQAVELVEDIDAAHAVGMHWGTVELTDEPHFEPKARFLAAAREAGWPHTRARIMKIGETLPLAMFSTPAAVASRKLSAAD